MPLSPDPSPQHRAGSLRVHTVTRRGTLVDTVLGTDGTIRTSTYTRPDGTTDAAALGRAGATAEAQTKAERIRTGNPKAKGPPMAAGPHLSKAAIPPALVLDDLAPAARAFAYAAVLPDSSWWLPEVGEWVDAWTDRLRRTVGEYVDTEDWVRHIVDLNFASTPRDEDQRFARLRDLASSDHVRCETEECRSLFIPTHHDRARFCSASCRSRQWRNEQRAARAEASAEGIPAELVPTALDLLARRGEIEETAAKLDRITMELEQERFASSDLRTVIVTVNAELTEARQTIQRLQEAAQHEPAHHIPAHPADQRATAQRIVAPV